MLCPSSSYELQKTEISQNPDITSEALSEKMSVFEITPISGSLVSSALRQSTVLHILITTICDNIWQPFFCESFWKCQEVCQFLNTTSSLLGNGNSWRESAWRHITLEATKGDSKTIRNEFVENMVNEFIHKLQVLIEMSKSAMLRKELADVFVMAVEVWNDSQNDGSRIKATKDPDQGDLENWIDASTALAVPNSALEINTRSLKSKKAHNMSLFPKITRISGVTSPKGLRDSGNVERTLFRGAALFEGTALFNLGAHEQEVRPEGMHNGYA
jgi:hypothetical protein